MGLESRISNEVVNGGREGAAERKIGRVSGKLLNDFWL
jgi:hypothetical protein